MHFLLLQQRIRVQVRPRFRGWWYDKGNLGVDGLGGERIQSVQGVAMDADLNFPIYYKFSLPIAGILYGPEKRMAKPSHVPSL